MFVFSAVLSSLNYFFIGIREGMMIVTVLIRGILIMGISSIFSKFLYETEQKSTVLLENENLKLENLTIQLNSLKNQLNPHFLFNSLNTLSWLINENKEKSQQYLQKLSQVLRYSLQIQAQSVVPLKEELMLLDSYIFLLAIRFGDNLKMTKELSEVSRFNIPPLSLQLLVENAIKHNIISSAQPMYLHISIDKDKQTLSVSNSLHPKPNSAGTGIGLANLNERFRILTNRSIEIQQDEAFTVILPLIA
ncbi:MAG: histidine kinase [Spirosomataceae bacterium]